MTSKVLSTVTAISALPMVAANADPQGSQAISEWQRDRLLDPPAEVLEQEREGQVFIYEEMLESDIDRAMSTQYERIERMMFIRTVPTDEEGEPEREEDTGDLIFMDDGC